MATLFIYGTLRDREVCERVLARPVALSDLAPATAPDFAIYRVAGAHYPCLLSQKGAMATGSLLTGLDDTDIGKLDQFEGENYQRASLVVLCDGMQVTTQYYQPNETLSTDGPWDLGAWQQSGKNAFLQRDFNLSGVRSPDDD